MKRFHFRSEQFIERPLEEVFDFFAQAQNLEELTPSWLSFRIETPLPIRMEVGTLIDYRLRLHGLPLKWQGKITAWEPPHRFVDEQVRGPYRLWIHEHGFEAAEGGTLVRDRVDYAVPGGSLVNKLLVAGDIEKIFEFRRRRLAALWKPARRIGGVQAPAP